MVLDIERAIDARGERVRRVSESSCVHSFAAQR
jgi:hypothetical protein